MVTQIKCYLAKGWSGHTETWIELRTAILEVGTNDCGLHAPHQVNWNMDSHREMKRVKVVMERQGNVMER